MIWIVSKIYESAESLVRSSESFEVCDKTDRLLKSKYKLNFLAGVLSLASKASTGWHDSSLGSDLDMNGNKRFRFEQPFT